MPLHARSAVAVLATAGLALILPTVATIPAADAIGDPAVDTAGPSFHRVNIDTAATGASFSVVGEVVAGEQDIVTSGYGALGPGGRPAGGGTLQVYRPGANLGDWTKVTVFDATAGIVFPNQSTVADVDGDGDQDLIVPSGYFFDTFPAESAQSRGAITWWENHGLGPAGALLPFERHDVITGQPWSYHGVQLTDLDGDGVKDLLSVGEQGRNAGDPTDDDVEMQFFKGRPDLSFADPIPLADVGGSLPVVHDVDGDGDTDIVSSQYFDLVPRAPGAASFLWLERTGTDTTLSADDFTPRTIATVLATDADRGLGMGFQIRPVPDFREAGTVSWIGTNHNNRCTNRFVPGEEVAEFTPSTDLTAQWTLTTLSNPATPSPACPTDYATGSYPVFSDAITSRYGYGQGAPGVFGYGDIDGDDDVDLLVSGDGDRRLFWIEQQASGSTVLHTLTDPGEHFGQAGGAVVADLDDNGTNELVFSSFDRSTVAIWVRDARPSTPTTPAVLTVPSSLRLSPGTTSVRAGVRKTWSVKLTGAPGGARRVVKVSFDPRQGRTKVLTSVRLGRTATDGVQRGSFTWGPTRAGRLLVTYAGSKVSDTLRDTRSSDAARVLIR